VALVALLLAAACSGSEIPIEASSVPDSVVTHVATGEWRLTVDGRLACTASNAPPSWTDSDFLTMCRLLTRMGP
jgi:hypothetical protein